MIREQIDYAQNATHTDEDIKKRYVAFYGDERIFADGMILSLRVKLSSLSEFMREIKVGFARFYNRQHNRRGYFMFMRQEL